MAGLRRGGIATLSRNTDETLACQRGRPAFHGGERRWADRQSMLSLVRTAMPVSMVFGVSTPKAFCHMVMTAQ